MKRRFRSILSLCLNLTLILAIPFNVVNATETHMDNNSGSSSSFGFMAVTLQPGEESRVGSNLINGKITTVCDIDATSGSVQYKVKALKDTTKFTMFMKEKDKMISEKSFTGAGALDFDARKYETVTFGVKNEAQVSDTFHSSLQATNSKSAQTFACSNGATRIIAPIVALLGGFLLLF